MTESSAAPGLPPAIAQLGRPQGALNSATCGVMVERVAQIAAGQDRTARRLAREAAEFVNEKCADLATVLVYDETFGTKNRIHWMLHLRSLDDYERLVRMGGAADLGDGVFGGHVRQSEPQAWDDAFVPGSVQETLMFPHRWGMFGTATPKMAQDPSMSPLRSGTGAPYFEVLPAAHQTTQDPASLLTTANAGVIMHRTIDFSHQFRAEARLFARTVAENTNLNATGHATALVFEELFGPMERMHFFIHMKSLSSMYVLMGIDARTDPSAPRASYLMDWVSPEKGGGGWDRMIREGGGRDSCLTPQAWAPLG